MLRIAPPAHTVRFLMVTRSAPVKLNGSVSAVALVELRMTVASMPAPSKVTSSRLKNLKNSVPKSKVPAVNRTTPPPDAARSATALSPTNFSVPMYVVPVVCDCAW